MTRRCAGFGCANSLEAMRADAVFCSRACAQRTKRAGDIPADWPQRSARFWAGVDRLLATPRVRAVRTPAEGVGLT